MNFTFIRAERSQEENQERAFIAASRRQDRDFKQRLESLQKASELHFARTGKRFEVTQAQVEHNGPLMEQGEDEKRRRQAQRYAPYALNRPRGVSKAGDAGSVTNEKTLKETSALPLIQTEQLEQEHARVPSQSPTHCDQCYNGPLKGLEKGEVGLPDAQHQGAVPGTELLDIVGVQEVEAEEPANSQLDDLPTSFFEMEDWQEYHERLDDEDIQKFLDVHFPRSRPVTPDEEL